MSDNIFIPSKIRIGFQERDDTYTGKLGYVIYYDAKNKIRKEQSFLGWIDNKIPVIEMDNTPQNGFIFNRGVNRHSSFSYSTSKIRVFDARDFEFEIDIGNLVEIMKHSDISHQEINEKCVFAWQGKELILLPINSDVYVKATAFTQKLLNPLNVRDFIVGQTFKNKSGEELIYLGEHIYHKMVQVKQHRHLISWEQKKTKQSFFFNINSNDFVATNKNTMIELYDENIHCQYPDFVENLQVGLNRFTFKDFVQTLMSKDSIVNDVFEHLKEYKQSLDEKNNNYHYSTRGVFPSHIGLLTSKGYSFFQLTQNNDKYIVNYINYNHTKIEKKSNSPLLIEVDYQRESSYYNNAKEIFSTSVESIYKATESQLKDIAKDIVQKMYVIGDSFYRIGFVNEKDELTNLNSIRHNAIETWLYFKQWKSKWY